MFAAADEDHAARGIEVAVGFNVHCRPPSDIPQMLDEHRRALDHGGLLAFHNTSLANQGVCLLMQGFSPAQMSLLLCIRLISDIAPECKTNVMRLFGAFWTKTFSREQVSYLWNFNSVRTGGGSAQLFGAVGTFVKLLLDTAVHQHLPFNAKQRAILVLQDLHAKRKFPLVTFGTILARICGVGSIKAIPLFMWLTSFTSLAEIAPRFTSFGRRQLISSACLLESLRVNGCNILANSPSSPSHSTQGSVLIPETKVQDLVSDPEDDFLDQESPHVLTESQVQGFKDQDKLVFKIANARTPPKSTLVPICRPAPAPRELDFKIAQNVINLAQRTWSLVLLLAFSMARKYALGRGGMRFPGVKCLLSDDRTPGVRTASYGPPRERDLPFFLPEAPQFCLHYLMVQPMFSACGLPTAGKKVIYSKLPTVLSRFKLTNADQYPDNAVPLPWHLFRQLGSAQEVEEVLDDANLESKSVEPSNKRARH